MIATTFRRTAVTATIAASAIALLATQALAQPPTTRVPDGATAAADAAGWSELGFADDAAPTVLLATDADFADALTAGAVQGLLEAPLLLTNPETLSPETAAEINRLGAEEAVIFGGDMAVSDLVQDEVEALGLRTERVEGATRIETAVAAQQRFFPDTTSVVLARAFGTDTDPTQAFADNLTVGLYSAMTNIPVLLTATDDLEDPTAAALTASAVDTVVIAGGESAVSGAVASEVDGLTSRGTTEEQPDLVIRRLGGDSRFSTAIAINNDLGFLTAADSDRVILIEGQADDAWVTGLPAASQAGNNASIVLANGDNLLTPTFDFLFDANVPLICGPGVSATACDSALEALQGMGEADMPEPGETPPGESEEEEPPADEEGNLITDILDDILDPLIPGLPAADQ